MSKSSQPKKPAGKSAVPTKAASMPPAGPQRPIVRTPWGAVDLTDRDAQARDPFEPDAPVTGTKAPTATGPRPGPACPPADEVAPLSPRELYEMMLTPAAHPVRPFGKKPAATPTGKVAAAKVPLVKPSTDPARFPPQANMVLSALEAGRGGVPVTDRRNAVRRPYRATAVLRLFSDQPGTPPWVLYTRDVHRLGLGFISDRPLPLGYNGTVDLPDPDGGDAAVSVPCTLLRCRPAAGGWYEGGVSFDRPQPAFDEA